MLITLLLWLLLIPGLKADDLVTKDGITVKMPQQDTNTSVAPTSTHSYKDLSNSSGQDHPPGVCRITDWEKMVTFNPRVPYVQVNGYISVTCREQFVRNSFYLRCVEENGQFKLAPDRVTPCIEKCKKQETWNPELSLHPVKDYYEPYDMVTIGCPSQYVPSHTAMRCITGPGKYVWSAPDVSCLEFTIQKDTTPTSISLRWACRPHSCSKYWRIWVNCQLCKSQAQIMHQDNEGVTFTDLQPFTQYNIIIMGTYNRRLKEMQITTRETAPEKPKIVKYPSMAENTIRWRLLSKKGIIQGYQMNISAQRDYNRSFSEEELLRFDANVNEYKIQFKYGTNYTINLRGVTSAGPGEDVVYRTQIPISEPPLLQNNEITVREESAALELYSVPDLHGPISYYEIIIFTEWNWNSSDECLTYRSKNSSTSSSAYTAAMLPAGNISSPMTLTLGDGQIYGGYVNVPLRQDHNYTVIVRVISKWNEVEKSSCTFMKSFIVSGKPYGISGLVAGLTSAVVVLLIVAVLLVIWKCALCRSVRCAARKASNQTEIPLNTQIGPVNKKKDIPVDELLEVIKNFRRQELLANEEADDEDNSNILPVGRYNEYQTLPKGPMYPCEVATAVENLSKNRYKKVLPYDGSRVVLKSNTSGSDYINASYIAGYKAPKFFIATQGPLPETLDDFWCMVWEQNSSVIVMLTGLEEQNKIKCECYWPEEMQTYGNITVSLDTIVHTGAIVTRSFSLKKEGCAVQKAVQHLHYLQWPDHDVPSKPSGLVLLVEQMNQLKLPGSGPVIVHCSAGIGRTGTFIALDLLLKMAQAVKKVNVYNCTLQLRKRRVNMVQNKKQYVFLYDILVETLLCGATSVTIQDIQKHINQMSLQDHSTQLNGYAEEYNAVVKLEGLYQLNSCKEGQKPENKSKNRNPEILPDDHCRPILMSITDPQGGPGYINAVFVNSNCQDDVFIVTQLPMKETLPDFWSLIWDYKCTSVVVMHRAEDLTQIAPTFWPDNGESRCHCFSVRKISMVAAPGYTETTLCLRNGDKHSESSLEVKIWQLDCWYQDNPVPENPAALISLIGETEKRQHQNPDSHILVTCCDGAKRSGLFCAGTIICDQIRSDGGLDVSQAVRSIKRRRRQFISNVFQYTFCYLLAQSYLDSFETYGNFK